MKKILIIRLTSLGDVIFTIPLACTLKENDSNIQIGWVVAEKGLDIIKGNPCVDKCHFVPLKEWKKRPFSLKTLKEFLQIIKEIRNEKYDIALDCQQMFKNLFLFLLCGAKRRITFKDAREMSILGGNEFIPPKANFRDFNYHIVERNLDFARYLGVDVKDIKFSLPESTQEVKNKINELLSGLDNKPIVIISPATTWVNKHWAEQNWADVVEALHEKCNLVFTGMESDKSLIDRILAKTKERINYTNLCEKTNLEELKELFSRAKLVISTDSGSTHLAWATGKPVVIAIFTCTPPMRFGPYGNNDKYFSIGGSELSCQPCFKKKCKIKNEHNICCNSPSADEVITIVNKVL